MRTFFPRDDKPVLTIQSGWNITWDMRRSALEERGADVTAWAEKVGELPANGKAIIATGRLASFTKASVTSVLDLQFTNMQVMDNIQPRPLWIPMTLAQGVLKGY